MKLIEMRRNNIRWLRIVKEGTVITQVKEFNYLENRREKSNKNYKYIVE
jgi:hypothetical protein